MEWVSSKLNKDILAGILFVIVISTISHFLFSSFGFNPTDDGIVLSGARRILQGQVPHRDFIAIRPSFHYFLHLPFVKFGGDYTIWLSRYFVWFQFAFISWAWVIFFNRTLGVFRSLKEKIFSALFVFFLSVHSFPIMAWSTIDGLFLLSMGVLFLSFRDSKLTKTLGYIFVGLTGLCKQGFLFLIPVSLIVFRDWRKIYFWVAAFIPILAILFYLIINGAIFDAFEQILSAGNYLFRRGIVNYLINWQVPWGILTGYFLAKRAQEAKDLEKKLMRKNYFSLILPIFFLIIPLLVTILILPLFPLIGYSGLSFGLWGIVVGIILYFIENKKEIKIIRLGIFVSLIGWAVSLSHGYGSPAFASGILTLFIFSVGLLFFREELTKNDILTPKFFPYFLLVSALIMSAVFGFARLGFIYRELPAWELTRSLDGIFPGAKLIKTNPNNYAVLAELKTLKQVVEKNGKKYAILPDIAANWIKDPQENPLPIDWPQIVELGNQNMVNRVIRELEAKRGEIIVIMQKFGASEWAFEFKPLTDKSYLDVERYYVIADYIRENFRKIGESQFFELYQ